MILFLPNLVLISLSAWSRALALASRAGSLPAAALVAAVLVGDGDCFLENEE